MKIEDSLNQIAREVFIQTGEKIDPYNMAIIRAMQMANQDIIQSNKALTDKISGKITSNSYHISNPTPLAALMLKWGWGIWVLLTVLILGIIYLSNRYIENEALVLKKRVAYREQQLRIYREQNPKSFKRYFGDPE